MAGMAGMAAIVLAGPVYAGAAASGVYANGLVVRLAGFERMPSADAATCDDRGVCRPGSAPGTVLVRVNIRLSVAQDGSAVPLSLMAGTASGISLATGADHRPAAIDCGNLAETTLLCTDLGTSLPDHVDSATPVTLCESFDVPAESVDALSVTITPPVPGGQVASATFTGGV